MSTNNYILNLLNIKDKNIFISKKIETRKIKGINYKVIEGILSYIPKYCPNCGRKMSYISKENEYDS